MQIEKYFKDINSQLRTAYKIATEAKKKGYDPEPEVEIPIAKNMAERVEWLIATVAPQIVNVGIPKRIKELEKKYGVLDWRISLIIAEEIAKEKFCKFKDKLEAIETGIRVGFAYLTLGTVASPLEGFTNIKLRKNKVGEDYFAIFYSGPIRSAGGTGAAVSILIADYVRKKLGYGSYDPTEIEIKRMITEINDYHERITNLQYLPTEREVDFLVRNLPVQIDGEPSEKIEVSTCKDLARIETNRIRNGPCLVIGECLAQKAPKLWKQLSEWGKDFDLEHWIFLKEFIKIQKKIKSGKVKEEKTKINPDYTYLKDLPAGRPVLTGPLAVGGFRLRYGRSRTSGFSSGAIHPATMVVLKNYIAIGTQLKTERPGKSTALTICDSIEGPIVLLNDGSVVRVDSGKEGKKVVNDIKEIIFLGDILFNYGDFYNRAHTLVPAGYCEEWWVQELEKATVNLFGSLDLDKLSELVEIPKNSLEILLKNPLTTKITAPASITLSKKLSIPLHPRYTYYWSTISMEQIILLLKWADKANIVIQDNEVQKVILPLEKEPKRALELLGVPHIVTNNEFVVIEKDDAMAFCSSFGVSNKTDKEKIKETIEGNKDKSVLELINLISEVKIMDKAGTFIGARMGRPEKAKIRQLTGSPQVLFPVGEEGGRLRSFQAALEEGKIRADFPIYYCSKCDKETILGVCPRCNKKAKRMYYCKFCSNIPKEICEKHGEAATFKTQTIDIKEYFNFALKKIKTKTYPDLIKGVRGTSNKDHVPEHLIKGILRAKHNIYVNKDGTTRYDMTQLGITHFKPKEIGTSIEKLKQLGYEKDIYGKELQDKNQVLELLPQDVILPACQESPDEGADKILSKVANFIDDLLVNLYDLKSFYNVKSEHDLVGHLILGLAPHTSAAILGRIIGFSRVQGYYAHPLFHAAHRRDLDGDESCVILLMDALLNFSRHYLPAHRGSTQDAPLVLTSTLIPSEVDDMVFDLDVVWKYPLEFYEACMQYKNPWDVKVEQLVSRLGTEKEYYEIGYTHPVSNINQGVKCSAYKLIPSMEEKLKGQMELAEKIRAVDTSDVARLVIEKHFLKDIRGNLRKFSMQQVRCVKCNEKYRRVPLIGGCVKCGSRLIFTISEGSIIKYLEPSISIANKYNVPVYLKQNLELTKRRIEGVFGKEKEKQEGLGKWFG